MKLYMHGGAGYGHYHGRDKYIVEKLKCYEPKCILKSKKGHPRHPLYLNKELELVIFYILKP
ncbi:DUF1643 domain-containing protein [Bacillus sp. NTK071]|nr:DUF1643 domain-containing protein [Bacillus sp. NTK071]